MAMAQKEWRHLNLTGAPGAIDFDVTGNWRILLDLIKEAICRADISAEDVLAVTSTSMREGMVLYDRDGREIWACSNVDARAEQEVIDLVGQGREADIYRITGQTFSISDAPRLLWVKRNLPRVYEQIHRVSMISDWVLIKLTGEYHVEPSNVSTSGFFDTMNRTWSDKLPAMLGFPADIYPPVVEPGTPLGVISPEAADLTGLPKTTKVIMGGGDAQLGCVGVGAVHDRDAVILGGTFWQQEVNVVQPTAHPEGKIRINCHAVPGLWQYEGISFLIGLTMRWFRDAFCREENEIAEKLNISAYALLSEQARNVPAGSYEIMPIFSDVMNYMQWKHAAPSLLNFDINDPARYGKPAVFRAMMENAAFNSLGNLKEIAAAVGFFPDRITFAGGASYSPLWCSIMASVLGVPVRTPRIKEATALGGFICAAVGAGLFADFNQAVQHTVGFEATYEPDPEEHQVYNQLFERWRRIYTHMLALSDSGETRHMWKAPGA